MRDKPQFELSTGAPTLTEMELWTMYNLLFNWSKIYKKENVLVNFDGCTATTFFQEYKFLLHVDSIEVCIRNLDCKGGIIEEQLKGTNDLSVRETLRLMGVLESKLKDSTVSFELSTGALWDILKQVINSFEEGGLKINDLPLKKYEAQREKFLEYINGRYRNGFPSSAMPVYGSKKFITEGVSVIAMCLLLEQEKEIEIIDLINQGQEYGFVISCDKIINTNGDEEPEHKRKGKIQQNINLGVEKYGTVEIQYDKKTMEPLVVINNTKRLTTKRGGLRPGDMKALMQLVSERGGISCKHTLKESMGYPDKDDNDDELYRSINRLKKYGGIKIESERGLGYRLVE